MPGRSFLRTELEGGARVFSFCRSAMTFEVTEYLLTDSGKTQKFALREAWERGEHAAMQSGQDFREGSAGGDAVGSTLLAPSAIGSPESRSATACLKPTSMARCRNQSPSGE